VKADQRFGQKNEQTEAWDEEREKGSPSMSGLGNGLE
jgi:hypothetical protein